MSFKTKVVIHTEYGGFSLTENMVEMLKARGCKWAEKCGKGSGRNPTYHLPYECGNPDALRQDPDLVAIVEELTVQYENSIVVKGDCFVPWRKRAELRRDLLSNLKVVEVTVDIDIEDYDGKETVRVSGGVW